MYHPQLNYRNAYRRQRGSPVLQFAFIVVGGVIGLAIGYACVAAYAGDTLHVMQHIDTIIKYAKSVAK